MSKPNIEIILQELIEYLSVVRQVGHTTTMLNGVKNSDGAIVLVHTPLMGAHIAENISNKNVDILTLRALADLSLRGSNKPLAIDNAALLVLCINALSEIKHLSDKIKAIKKVID